MASTSEPASADLAADITRLSGADDRVKFSSPLDNIPVPTPPPKVPQSNPPPSMATPLTSVETPSGAESCASAEAGGHGEVLSREPITGGASGMSEAAMEDGRALVKRLSGAGMAVKRQGRRGRGAV